MVTGWGTAALAAMVFWTAGQSAAQPKALVGHSDPVYTTTFTPNGQWAVTASFDETLKLWDATTGKPVRTMEGHEGLVISIAVSPDGSRLASGSLDRQIKLWDVPVNAPVGELQGHEGAVRDVDTSENGRWYASGGADEVLKLWNVAEGKVLKDVPGNEHPITRVAFRNDNQQVATANEAGIVRLFGLQDGEEAKVEDQGAPQGSVGAHEGPVTGLVYAPNNSFLLTAGKDGFVRRWPNQFPEHRTVPGHGGNVNVVRVSPNGARLASASADETVRLWNFSDGKELQKLGGHGDQVTAMAFSTNSARLITGSDDKIARVFDANNGELVKALPAHEGAITAVAIHPNTQEVAVGDAKGTVKVYKVEDGSEVRALAGHGGAITGLAYTPNQSAIVSASADKTVRVWNAGDGKEQRKIDLPSAATCLAVSADSARLAVGGENGSLRTFQIGDGKPLLEQESPGGKITDVEYSRDNARLAVCSADGVVRVRDRESGRVLQFFHLPEGACSASFSNDNKTLAYAGAAKEIHVDQVSVVFAVQVDAEGVNDLDVYSNSAQFFTAGQSGKVQTWNAGNGSSIREYPGPTKAALSVAVSPNNQQLAAGSADGTLYVWNQSSAKLQYETNAGTPVTGVAFSRESDKLVAVGADQKLRSIDPAPPNPEPEQPLTREVKQELTGHEKPVRGLVFTGDNRTLLTASEDGTLKKWSIAASGEVASLNGHGGQVYDLAFSPDGKVLASASSDKTVRLWDVEEQNAIKTLATQQEAVYGVAFSPDGKQIATAGADNSVRLYNAATGIQERVFTGPEHPLYSLAFSPDGKQIAAGGMGLGTNRPIYVWDVDNPSPAFTLEGHEDDCYSVTFNESGTRLLTGGYSGTVKVWNLGNQKPLFETQLPIVLYNATYAPDGTRIAVSANDGKVHFVDVPEAAR